MSLRIWTDLSQLQLVADLLLDNTFLFFHLPRNEYAQALFASSTRNAQPP